MSAVYTQPQIWTSGMSIRPHRARSLVALWILIALLTTLYLLQAHSFGLMEETLQPVDFMGSCNGLPGPC
jgi:hypothetical protein